MKEVNFIFSARSVFIKMGQQMLRRKRREGGREGEEEEVEEEDKQPRQTVCCGVWAERRDNVQEWEKDNAFTLCSVFKSAL